MQTSLKITFRHMTPSAALDAHVREHVADLARVHDRIIACDVVIDAPAGRHAQGESFDVRVNVKVPNGNFSVRNDRAADASPRDVYAAVREAFGIGMPTWTDLGEVLAIGAFVLVAIELTKAYLRSRPSQPRHA